MLDLVAKYQYYIKSFQVHLYDREGPLFRFKAELQLKDNSKISTFPHHKHIDNGVQESTETSFSDVLESVVQKRFKS
jgi:hypothetical protein